MRPEHRAPAAGGRLIAVVGPSGVGKDSVMRGLHAQEPRLHLVRRVITRPPDQGGEDHEAVSVDMFLAMAARGAFAAHWGAHGLFYGIPQSVQAELARGRDCLANFSRKALGAAATAFPGMVVLHITAPPEILAARLAARGRETEAGIAARLAEAQKPLPAGLRVLSLANDSALEHTIARALALLQPIRG